MKQFAQESYDKLKSVKRHRINFFLEENIKEIFGKCTKELKLLVLKDMINDTKKHNMTQQERKDRIYNKAFAMIATLKIEIKSLDETIPYFAYTQDMIDGQINFKERELELWNHIAFLNEQDEVCQIY